MRFGVVFSMIMTSVLRTRDGCLYEPKTTTRDKNRLPKKVSCGVVLMSTMLQLIEVKCCNTMLQIGAPQCYYLSGKF